MLLAVAVVVIVALVAVVVVLATGDDGSDRPADEVAADTDGGRRSGSGEDEDEDEDRDGEAAPPTEAAATTDEVPQARCQGSGPPVPPEPIAAGGAPDGTGRRVGLLLVAEGSDSDPYDPLLQAGLEAAVDAMGVVPDVRRAALGSDGTGELQAMVDAGDELIVVGSFTLVDGLAPFAAANPEVAFVTIEAGEVPGTTAVEFSGAEGGFLVGAIAAQASESGEVGFIGAVRNPLFEQYQAGFEAGAAAVDEDVFVESVYLGEDGDFSGFGDPEAAAEAVDQLSVLATDVVFEAVGSGRTGVFEAATDRDWLAIGAEVDHYGLIDEALRPCLLTSLVKRVDVAAFRAVQDHLDGTLTTGVLAYGLADGMIDYATSGGQVRDPEQVADLVAKVVSGEIVVPTEP